MTDSTKKMPYGKFLSEIAFIPQTKDDFFSVRLGNSGLKVSKIILGCMSYGTPGWRGWVLDEAESFKHIKAACVATRQCFSISDYHGNLQIRRWYQHV